MTELKPCPFCGSNDIEYHPGMTTMGNEAGVVRCNCCYSQVPVMKYGKRVKEPFVEWNRRANECDREYIIGQLDKMVEESKQTAGFTIGDGLTIERNGLSSSVAKGYAIRIRESLDGVK